jgi:hypothetical protein
VNKLLIKHLFLILVLGWMIAVVALAAFPIGIAFAMSQTEGSSIVQVGSGLGWVLIGGLIN